MTGLTLLLRTILWAALLALSLAAGGAAVDAQVVCAPHDKIAAALKQNFAEEVRAAGITSGGALIEIYTSPRGTWTVVLTAPDGPSCLMADGVDWQMLPAPKGPEA